MLPSSDSPRMHWFVCIIRWSHDPDRGNNQEPWTRNTFYISSPSSGLWKLLGTKPVCVWQIRSTWEIAIVEPIPFRFQVEVLRLHLLTWERMAIWTPSLAARLVNKFRQHILNQYNLWIPRIEIPCSWTTEPLNMWKVLRAIQRNPEIYPPRWSRPDIGLDPTELSLQRPSSYPPATSSFFSSCSSCPSDSFPHLYPHPHNGCALFFSIPSAGHLQWWVGLGLRLLPEIHELSCSWAEKTQPCCHQSLRYRRERDPGGQDRFPGHWHQRKVLSWSFWLLKSLVNWSIVVLV